MLKVGQTAPDFKLADSENHLISLADLKGKKVVIYFYPKDDTPGCTKQACAFRDAYKGFIDSGITVIGISKDSIESHQKFVKKYQLPFTLLADTQGNVIKDYEVQGVFGAARVTYIVSEEGVIEKVFEKASPDTNAADILEYIK